MLKPRLSATIFGRLLVVELACAQTALVLDVQTSVTPQLSSRARIAPHYSVSVGADGSVMGSDRSVSAPQETSTERWRLMRTSQQQVSMVQASDAAEVQKPEIERGPTMKEDAKTGEACYSDFDCISSTCDTHGGYGCKKKCVVRDADWRKTASFNCPPPDGAVQCTDPTYPYLVVIGGMQYCYSSLQFAKSRTGPCESWCAMDLRAQDGCGGCCGPISDKLCAGSATSSPIPTAPPPATNRATPSVKVPTPSSRRKCVDPKFPYPAVIGGHDFCYSQMSYASRRSGPCESWCVARDFSGATSIGDGCNGCCGDIQRKLCA